MKNTISFLLVLLLGCNNSNKNVNGNSLTDSSGDKTTTKGPTSGTGCGALILFHQGAIIEGTSYDAAGKVTAKQTTTVTDVKDEAGVLIAHCSAVMEGAGAGKNMEMIYKCDGSNLYMDMTALMQNFSSLKNIKGEIKPIEFPINISEGQTLPDASYTITMDKGPTKMDITTTYKNRTVGPKEKITTTGGSWDCFKVHCDIASDIKGLDETTAKVMEAVKNSTKMEMAMWFSPGFGIVKTETYRAGKLSSRSEITSIKD